MKPNHVRLTLQPLPEMERPGNIVSGPALMGLIDVAAYGVVLAHIGPVAMAVTHTMSVSFLRACRWNTVVADARLIKLGKRLATVDVRLWQESEEQLIAQSTVGYALP
ncbi:MAG TPA: PaaI family thioesterase [Steroidobacter sp.]